VDLKMFNQKIMILSTKIAMPFQYVSEKDENLLKKVFRL